MVDGCVLDVGVVDVVELLVEVGIFVLKDGVFGWIVGDEILLIDGISVEVVWFL